MDIESFIAEVYARPILWNRKHENHHNNVKLRKVWREVGQKFGTTEAAARKKWKSLRDTFRKRFIKIPKMEVEDLNESPYVLDIDWPYFRTLLFLHDQFSSSETLDHLKDDSSPVKKQENIEVTSDNASFQLSLSPIPSVDGDRNSIRPSISRESLQLTNNSESDDNLTNLRVNRKRRSDSSVARALLGTEKEKVNYLQYKLKRIEGQEKEKRRQEENDDDLHFLKSLLPYIKNLTATNKLIFRAKTIELIQELVK